MPARLADPVDSRAPFGRVEVQLENALFLQRALQPPRQVRLERFAHDQLLAPEKQIARELHGDRAAAALVLSFLDVGLERILHLVPVEPLVLEELRVLRANHAEHERPRDRGERGPVRILRTDDERTRALRSRHVEGADLARIPQRVEAQEQPLPHHERADRGGERQHEPPDEPRSVPALLSLRAHVRADRCASKNLTARSNASAAACGRYASGRVWLRNACPQPA